MPVKCSYNRTNTLLTSEWAEVICKVLKVTTNPV